MPRFVKLWPGALSAVLLLCAFPPINFNLLALIAITPFLASLMKGGAKRSLAQGYVFGFIYMLAQMAWLHTLVTRWTSNPTLAVFTWLLTGFLGAWYFALFGWLANRSFRRGWPWLVPLVWAGIEVFRSYIPGLAFPWGLMADPLYPFPSIIQGAYFGSIFFVSAWCALCSMILAMWLGGGSWKQLRPYTIVFVILAAASFMRLSSPEPTKKMTITVGQLGVDTAFGDPATQKAEIAKAIDSLTLAAISQQSQLLILPEGTAEIGASFPPATPPFPMNPSIPVIFGAQRGENPRYQSAVSFDGKKWLCADKTRLVIFGEYVPLRNTLPFLANFHLASGDLTPGDHLGMLDVRDMKVGPLICFEGMFPDLAYKQAQGGARLLAFISDDDWYMGTSAPEQLKSAAVWRAVETGLPLVRSASLGYSMAVDSHGRILEEARLRDRFPLHAEVPIPDHADPFPYFPVFPLVSVAGTIAALLIPWLPKPKVTNEPQGNRRRTGRNANAGGRE